MMSDKKTIVSLGLTRSGKTNYIAAALVYMATSPTFKEWTIKQNNHDLSFLIDRFEERLKQGSWYDKTQPDSKPRKNVFDFDIPRRFSIFPPYLDFQKSVTLNDWSGEIFSKFARNDPYVDEAALKNFKWDCKNAEGFILCLDGKRIRDDWETREVQNALRRFCEFFGWLTPANNDNQGNNTGDNQIAPVPTDIKRNFALVVTKSDLLIRHPDFCANDSNKLSLDKLCARVRESYRSFFGILKSQNCNVGVFPVSLVPSDALRKIDPKYGAMPLREKWDLKTVMKSSLLDTAAQMFYGERYFGNMYGALLWLLEML